MGDIIDNRTESRFEVTRDGHTAELIYRVEDGRIVLIHTHVPEELEGRGVGGELVQAALQRAASEGLTAVPMCPYARRWLRKHLDSVGDVAIDWAASPTD